MMGVHLGEMGDIMAAAPANPKGFWENTAAMRISDAVLASQGCDWRRVSKLEPDKLLGDSTQEIAKQAASFLTQLDANRPWALKDPRICLIAPFWLSLLEVPVCVFVYRRPLEVAHSLLAAQQIPLTVGIALWERYTLDALRYSAELPRVHLSYGAMLKDPIPCVRYLHDGLKEIGVWRIECPSEKEVLSFIDKNLYRQQSAVSEQEEFLNLAQRRLFRSLETGAAFTQEAILDLSQGAALVIPGLT